MAAKFITAPDRISTPSDRLKVLLIDAEWKDVENLTYYCMTRPINIDFYIFAPTSIVTDWIDHAMGVVDVVLLNDRSIRKNINNNAILHDSRTKLFGHSNCEYTSPLDYMTETFKQQ